MKYKWILTGAVVIVVAIVLVSVFTGFFGSNFSLINRKPRVEMSYPSAGAVVFGIVMISGSASDPNAEDEILSVEIRVNEGNWIPVDGTTLWSYDWVTYEIGNGQYTIDARSSDGTDYSDLASVTVTVQNPTSVDSGSHQWAVLIAAANFPEKNETKLGNGGLYLAEDIVAYLVSSCGYPTSNVVVLFDDGWVRSDNGYGEKEKTLQQRQHEYAISYGGATKANVLSVLDHLISQSNTYEDSEVFLWIFNHGVGDQSKSATGGKLLQSSEVFLWDGTLTDKDLGDLLAPLSSEKTTVLVDACYAGGFADRTILNFRTSLLMRSGIPKNGRVVITGTSKFRCGYASTTQGPVFSFLWLYGLTSGDADGFRPGLLDRGVPRRLKIFQDGQVSVEEAFYYARYTLRTDEYLKEFSSMQPQINDMYPHKGMLRSRGQLVLGIGED